MMSGLIFLTLVLTVLLVGWVLIELGSAFVGLTFGLFSGLFGLIGGLLSGMFGLIAGLFGAVASVAAALVIVPLVLLGVAAALLLPVLLPLALLIGCVWLVIKLFGAAATPTAPPPASPLLR